MRTIKNKCKCGEDKGYSKSGLKYSYCLKCKSEMECKQYHIKRDIRINEAISNLVGNWKEYPFNMNYLISDDGKVFSKSSLAILAKPKKSSGYIEYNIAGKYILAHRLVAITWIDNKYNLPVVNHIDGNKENNTISNLEWTTTKGNVQHAWTTGLMEEARKKFRYINRKIDDETAFFIKNSNLSSTELSKIVNLSRQSINDIQFGRTWKHI